MDSELPGEVIQGIKAMAGVKAFLVLPVAALHLAVVTRCIGTNQLVANARAGGSFLKQRGTILFARKEAVGELRAVICLGALDVDALERVPLDQLVQKIGGGIGGLFQVGSQETQTCPLLHADRDDYGAAGNVRQ